MFRDFGFVKSKVYIYIAENNVHNFDNSFLEIWAFLMPGCLNFFTYCHSTVWFVFENNFILFFFQFSIAAEQPELLEDLKEDNRFHPTIIGTLLLIFMFCVSAFVSNIESMSYFDAFYACFITYSAVGFGDLDIYVSFFF